MPTIALIACAAIYLILVGLECTSLSRNRESGGWGRFRTAFLTLAALALLLSPGVRAALTPQTLPAETAGTEDALALPLGERTASLPEEDRGAAPAKEEADVYWYIHHFAGRYGVDPLLVQALIRVESNFDPKAVSHRGAKGLMQINGLTARHLGLEDPFDVRENIEGGTRYLQMLLKRHRWNLRLALASYNAGPEAVRRFGGVPPYRETRRYVWRVIREYRSLKLTADVFREQNEKPARRARSLSPSAQAPAPNGSGAVAYRGAYRKASAAAPALPSPSTEGL